MWMAYALLAAVCFGFRGILYHWTSQQPMNRNLMLFGVFFTGAIVCFGFAISAGQRWTPEAAIGLLMGMFSFAASMSMYKGFAVGKASLVAVLTGLPPVVVALLAYAMWGETISGWKLSAFGIILISVLMLRYSNDISFKQLQGAQWGLLAMLFFGFNDVTAKQSTLLGADMLPTLFMMFVTGAALFCGCWLAERRGRTAKAHSESSGETGWSGRKTFLWGTAVGITNVLGMMTIMSAFQQGVTGLVSAIVALNVLMILLYSRIFTKERFKRLELAGIALALVGMTVLRITP
jgi:transporter family protein